MSAHIDMGHFNNVSNFEDLISLCSTYGANYKPYQNGIQLATLQQLYACASNNINSFAEKQTAYKKAVAARSITFEPLKMLATRILNAYIACGAGDKEVKLLKFYVDKIRGIRKPKVKPAANATENNPATEATTHSTLQQSFDNIVEHYTHLITIVNADALYQPNEYELSAQGLKDLLVDMKAKNTAVIDTLSALRSSRTERNTLLYDDEDGLVEKAFDVKKYIKSVFGSKSDQYKQINAIHFRQIIK